MSFDIYLFISLTKKIFCLRFDVIDRKEISFFILFNRKVQNSFYSVVLQFRLGNENVEEDRFSLILVSDSRKNKFPQAKDAEFYSLLTSLVSFIQQKDQKKFAGVSFLVMMNNMFLPAQVQLIYYLLIACTGLIGNITTIIVFSQRRLRSLRSSFFLTCLAVTDLVFILILIIVLLDELYFPIMTKPVCMLTIYLSHVASFLSSNFTLAYTSHRLIAVLFPIKATTFLKQRTNRILALTLFLFACSFYSLSFPVTTTRFRSNSTTIVDCEEDRNKPLLFPFLVLDTLFTFIIPFSLITLMNLAIVYKLKGKYSTTTTTTTTTSQSETQSFVTKSDRTYLTVRPTFVLSSKERMNSFDSFLTLRKVPSTGSVSIRSTQCRAAASTKTTKMLLAASTVFLVFNLPYHFLLFCFLFIENEPSWILNAVNIARLWFFASFSVNFFVYAICGQRFRREIVHLLNFLSKRNSSKFDVIRFRRRSSSFSFHRNFFRLSSFRRCHSQ